jgi:hypothetical protein
MLVQYTEKRFLGEAARAATRLSPPKKKSISMVRGFLQELGG